MATQRRINETYTCQLDYQGNGSLWFGAHGRDVNIARIHVRTSPIGPEGTVKIYEQYRDPAYTIYSTPKGSSGDSQDMDLLLTDGQGIWIEWLYSTPSAQGFARIVGLETRESNYVR